MIHMIPLLVCGIVLHGALFHSRETGARLVTTDLIMRVIVKQQQHVDGSSSRTCVRTTMCARLSMLRSYQYYYCTAGCTWENSQLRC